MNDLTAPATFTNADRALMLQVAQTLGTPSAGVAPVSSDADMTAVAQFTVGDRELLIGVAKAVLATRPDSIAPINPAIAPVNPAIGGAASQTQSPTVALFPDAPAQASDIPPVSPDTAVPFTQRDRDNIGRVMALLTAKFPHDI